MGAKYDRTKRYASFLVDGIRRGFQFDGCTGAPDFDFRFCCDRHDYDYQDITKTRAKADADLRRCIIRKGKKGDLFFKAEHVVVAWVYWAMVRIFGSAHWNKKQAETVEKIKDFKDGYLP